MIKSETTKQTIVNLVVSIISVIVMIKNNKDNVPKNININPKNTVTIFIVLNIIGVKL